MTGDTNKTAALVFYYAPAGTKVRPFPPRYLRSQGFVQFDGSVYIGHFDALPTVPIGEWEACGMRVKVMPTVEEQWPVIRIMAIEGLERRVGEIRTYLERGLEHAAEILGQAEKEQSAQLVKKGVGRTRAHLRAASRELAYANKAAFVFDITRDVVDLFEALRADVSMKESLHMADLSAAKEKAKAYPDYVPPNPRRRRAKKALAQMTLPEPTSREIAAATIEAAKAAPVPGSSPRAAEPPKPEAEMPLKPALASRGRPKAGPAPRGVMVATGMREAAETEAAALAAGTHPAQKPAGDYFDRVVPVIKVDDSQPGSATKAPRHRSIGKRRRKK